MGRCPVAVPVQIARASRGRKRRSQPLLKNYSRTRSPSAGRSSCTCRLMSTCSSVSVGSMSVARVLFLVSSLVLLEQAAMWVLWRAEPRENTPQRTFDIILVLGTPSLANGSASPTQRERVLEGVREWRRGVSPRIVMSGGAAHNQWVEAHSMALLAEQQGVPSSDILEEQHSQNTIQNVYYTVQIMHAHGWQSADVVSSWNHLPRVSRILAHFPILWRTHAAPWPKEAGLPVRWLHDWSEAQYCLKLRLVGFPTSCFISANQKSSKVFFMRNAKCEFSAFHGERR
jgi:uncharacterized SAM-binding protein YcdF (DUF218 family)